MNKENNTSEGVDPADMELAAYHPDIPEKYKHLWPAAKPGARINHLVSLIDMPKTWLAITGSKIPPEILTINDISDHDVRQKEREDP